MRFFPAETFWAAGREPFVTARTSSCRSTTIEHKDYSVRAQATGDRDEVALLVDAFNGMLVEILKEPSQIEAHVEISTFNIRYQFANIALVRPLRLDYRGGIATLQQTEFKGTGTDVTLQGVIPVKSANTAFNLAANGSMDLSLLQTMTKGLKSSGRIELALTGRGADFKHLAMQGHLRIENAYLSTDLVPVGIEGVNGVLNISGNRIDIGQLTGTVGGGTLSAQGYMTYGSQASFNLGLQGKSIRVRYPEGLRSVVDCNLHLNGNEADSTLSGRVVIDRLSFT